MHKTGERGWMHKSWLYHHFLPLLQPIMPDFRPIIDHRIYKELSEEEDGTDPPPFYEGPAKMSNRAVYCGHRSITYDQHFWLEDRTQVYTQTAVTSCDRLRYICKSSLVLTGLAHPGNFGYGPIAFRKCPLRYWSREACDALFKGIANFYFPIGKLQDQLADSLGTCTGQRFSLVLCGIVLGLVLCECGESWLRTNVN